MKQVLINLIDNTINYIYKNHRLKISFFDPYKNYLVEITDEETAIVKHIIETHIQTINVKSTIIIGTSFSVTV